MTGNREKAIEFLRAHTITHMATTSPEGKPWVRAMSIARVDDEFGVWIATFKKSNKIAHLNANPAVCLSTFDAGVSLQCFGIANIIDEQKVKDELWEEDWRCYFPDGPTDPDYIVARIQVTDFNMWDMKGSQD
ncbi:MAG: pyridoxamine 5'-phosphate oxidase family protein [Planctomycetota bacterium]